MSRTPGSPKSGGRQRGSLDRGQRQLVSAQLAHSIMATFELLGGTAAMLKWAENNQTIFYCQILSRLMPAPPKPDDEAPAGPVFNINALDSFEIARRLAFVLAAGAHAQQELEQPVAVQEKPDATDS